MGKYETIPFNSFMQGTWREEKAMVKKMKQANYSVMAAGSVYALHSTQASAAGYITDKIIHAFDPLIELCQACAYPVAFVGMSAGFLLIMLGQKSKGLAIVKYAAIGYIGMQFVPGIMKILVEVGKSIGM